MEQPSPSSEQTPRPLRPVEQEAVLTTIVGGRPPGSGKPIGRVPRGIEVLVKKAAVDADFKKLLLDKRAEAAGEIGLELTPAEVLMLRAVPAEQLEGIIARTSVPEDHRRAFLGKAAVAMLAAVAVSLPGCGGVRPDRPPDRGPALTGIAPDRPEKKEKPPENKDQGKQGPAPTLKQASEKSEE